jgi:hypothetical protein
MGGIGGGGIGGGGIGRGGIGGGGAPAFNPPAFDPPAFNPPAFSGPSFGNWFSRSMDGWEDHLLYVIGGLLGVALVLGGIVALLTMLNRQAMREMELEGET